MAFDDIIDGIKEENIKILPIAVTACFIAVEVKIPKGIDRKEFIKNWYSGSAIQFPIFLRIPSCGNDVIIKTIDDFPLQDIPCPCKDPNHWLVRWIII